VRGFAEKFPERADEFMAFATMEWINVRQCEALGNKIGLHVSLKTAEKLGRKGHAFAQRFKTLESVAKVVQKTTPPAVLMFERLGKRAQTREMKSLAKGLAAHEIAIRDWLKSELDGKPDGAAKIFAFLERRGISREQAVTPRHLREDVGGETKKPVLAFFGDEVAADKAAQTLRKWDEADEYLKLDAVGVLVTDNDGTIKEQKLGMRAGKRGLGIGVTLGVIAAMRRGDPSVREDLRRVAAGGEVIGQFFRQGLRMSGEDLTSIRRELDEGRAAPVPGIDE
jgi:hypothetical protein